MGEGSANENVVRKQLLEMKKIREKNMEDCLSKGIDIGNLNEPEFFKVRTEIEKAIRK